MLTGDVERIEFEGFNLLGLHDLDHHLPLDAISSIDSPKQ